MRVVKRTTKFKRDSHRLANNRTAMERLDEVIEILAADGQLSKRYRDHSLAGSSGVRDCHVCPDVVLLYTKPDPGTLLLLRLGSHSELFS